MIQQSDLRAEISRLTKAISNIFTVEGDLQEAELEELHDRFVECIEATNGRLKKCDELLRKGLRVEAIQECEVDPDLLDLVTELDIPEWSAWADYVRQFGIPRQPDLLIHVAADLNEAYNQAQSLDSLLRLHRLHALARSPLKHRIVVLRRIAKKDDTNPVWSEDLREYENVRFRQFGAELQQQNDNLDHVSELWSELKQSPWINSPPKKLIEKAEQIYDSLLVADARKKLIELEKTINAAFSEFDITKAESARVAWAEQAGIAKLSEQDDLSVQVKAAFDWLDQEREASDHNLAYTQALNLLEHMLDQDVVSRSKLTRGYNAVQRFDEAIPERVLRRYQERLSNIALTEKRRGKLVLLTSIAVVLMVGTVALFAMNIRSHSANIASVRDSLQELVKAKRYTQAEEFYEQLFQAKPEVAKAPEVQQVYLALQDIAQQDEARKLRLKQLLDQVRETILGKPTWESIKQSQITLQEAESITHGETELVRVREIERDLDRAKGKLQQEVNAQFQRDVDELATRTANVEHLTLEQVRELKVEAQDLKQRPYVSRSVRTGSEMELIIRKISSRERHLSLLSLEEQRLFAVRNSIGMRNLYESALESYLQGVKYGNRLQDFKAVMQHDVPFLERMVSWNKLVKKWGELRWVDSPQLASQAIPIMDQLQSNYTDFPGVKAILQLRPHLQSISKRIDASGKSISQQLTAMFRKDVFNMNYLEEKRGSRYYFFGVADQQADVVTVDVLVDARDLARTESQSFPKTDLKRLEGRGRSALAPHSKFSRAATKIIARQNKTFEARMCAILYALLENKEMDPLLRCGLLQYIVEQAGEGSSILAKSLTELESLISTSVDINDINWLDNDSETKVLKERTRAQLDRIAADLREVYKVQVQPQVDSFYAHKPALSEFTWVACLMKDTTGQWICEKARGSKKLEAGRLVIGNYNNNSDASTLAIGIVKNGQLILDQSNTHLFIEGRPIFLLTEVK